MDKMSFYSFETKLNLKTLIKKFQACNTDFSDAHHNPNEKYEEFKPCDDECRVLLANLQTYKTIQYVFEVDGIEKISSNDSMTSSECFPYMRSIQRNEINIEN